MKYIFKTPRREGNQHGKPFYAVEVEEWGSDTAHRQCVLARTSISLEHATAVLSLLFPKAYREDLKK